MNQPLNNTDKADMERDKKLRIIEKIVVRIYVRFKEIDDEFETFYSLLSAIVWQSPTELAEEWVRRVAKEEYEELLKTDDDKGIDRVKQLTRKGILSFIWVIIRAFSQNPSLAQQIKSRFLVQNILAHELPIDDYDRVMAKELWMPYGTWQSMLWLFSHYPDFLKLLKLSSTRQLEEWTNALWEDCYILNAPEWTPKQISSLSAIPGISVQDYINTEMRINNKMDLIIFQMESSALFISHNVLRRYENIIGMEEERTKIRIAIDDKYFGEWLPVWKKRFDTWGNKKPEPKYEHKLVPEWV